MADEQNIVRRILPHDSAAEAAVIGSMMIDSDAIAVAERYVTGDDFYQKANGLLFEAIVGLDNDGLAVDGVTLRDRLKTMDAPENIAQDQTLAEMISSVPTSTSIEFYAKIVANKAQLRRMIRTMEDQVNACYADSEPTDVIMAQTEQKMFQVLQQSRNEEFTPITDIVMSAIGKISLAAQQNSSVTGLATGFQDLDYKTSGFQPSDLILIAARPSMGKTAFVLNIADHMALKENYTVAIFSLEMSKEQLVNRLFAQESNIDAQKLRNGKLTGQEWDSLVAAADAIGRSNLIIDDTPGISVPELRSKCRRYKLEKGLDIILIDYLQLMTAAGRNNDSRQQEISEISRSLKALARELHVPVVALSQLSRAVEQRPDHRPVLSDLRESGAIEQDADVVMFLYREDYYKKDTERKGIADVIIAKQRNGPLADIELAWLPEYTKFASIARNIPQQ